MTAAEAARASKFIVWEPPRHTHWAPLSCQVNLFEGVVDDSIGHLVRPVGEKRAEEAAQLALTGHEMRPPTATTTGRSSASMAARIARWA